MGTYDYLSLLWVAPAGTSRVNVLRPARLNLPSLFQEVPRGIQTRAWADMLKRQLPSR